YKAVDDLVDQLARYWMRLPADEAATLVPERAEVLRRLFPVLGRVPALADLPEGPTIRDPLEVRTLAFEAFRSLLQRIAERHRLVVFLDDMQWVDADSISLLNDLVRPPDPPRMLLVLGSRTERPRADSLATVPARPERGGLEQLLRTPGLPVREVDLGPLTEADALQLAHGLLIGGDAARAHRIARESGGVPFFLRELAMWVESGAEGEVRLDDVVRARVARLPARTREVLRLACVAGEPVSLRTLAAAADCSGDELAREVRTLRSTSLLRSAATGAERVEPYHDRIREVVGGDVDAGEGRQLHRKLALALERWSEGDAVRLARHWSGAGEHQRAAD
ncbi:MAG TPA: AAA family ATPase, partial [Planctomycetota bacterium]|nr:AAA family ATPase [Planctomycetota bacterium]